jgi:hypothetical protein
MNPRSLPLALLLALAATGAGAEEFRTSNGVVHSLSPLATVTSEPALRQAMVAGERMLVDQLADVAKAEKARSLSSAWSSGMECGTVRVDNLAISSRTWRR